MELWIFSGVIALVAVILIACSSLSTPTETVTEDGGSFVRLRATGSPSRRMQLLLAAREQWIRQHPSARIVDEIWLGPDGSNRHPNQLILLLRR